MNSLLFIRMQPYSLSPSILTPLPLLSPVAGDIGTLVLPEGMQHLYFDGCSGLTGKAKGEVTSEGHTLLYTFCE